MYAQQVEGENWRGEKMDMGKIDKMSGMSAAVGHMQLRLSNAKLEMSHDVHLLIRRSRRSADRTAIRAYECNSTTGAV